MVARRKHDRSPSAIASVRDRRGGRRNPDAHAGRSRGARRPRRSSLSFFTALRTTLAGDFGASITPARSGAEPARFLVLAEAGIPTPSALVVLFAELFLEALSLATVVIVVAIVFRHAGIVLGALVGVVGAYAGFVIGIAAIAVVLSRRHVNDAPPTWARRLGLGGRRWDVIQRWFAQVRSTVDSVRAHRHAVGGGGVQHVGDSRRDAALRAAGARARSGRERAARAVGALAARACCTAPRSFRRRAAVARWRSRFVRRSRR